jgi:hypothetical protein
MKNLQQSCHLKILKIEMYIMKVCNSLINSSVDDVLFFNFYFDTTLTFFPSP